MNEVMQSILSRRSVRAYEERQISDADLQQILQAAVYAPSGNNMQSWQFTVLQNQSDLQALANAIKAAVGKPETEDYSFYHAPTLIIVSNDRQNGNAMADCAAAMENIFLSAHSLGIGSVWINQLKGICDDAGIRPLLDRFGIPKDHVVCASAALGYAKVSPEAPDRKQGTIHFVK